jgi:hypothetical protein
MMQQQPQQQEVQQSHPKSQQQPHQRAEQQQSHVVVTLPKPLHEKQASCLADVHRCLTVAVQKSEMILALYKYLLYQKRHISM